MATLVLGARILLAVVFAIAGTAKLRDLPGSRRALAEFGVPSALIPVGAVLLPVAELATAVALIPPPTAQWGALAALLLLLAFIGGIVNAMARGGAPDCHCFGQLHSEPAGRGTLIRNMALAAVAGLVLVEGPGPSLGSWVADRSAAELVAVAAVIAAGVLAVLAYSLRRDNRELKRRLDEALTEIASLPPGLPIGSLAPSFALPSIRGGEVSLEELRARGRPVALVFMSPGCGPCATLFPQLYRWQTALAEGITVTMISNGSAEANRAAVGGAEAEILLEDDLEVAKSYRVSQTPTALVVSPEGRIASVSAWGNAIEPLIRLTLRRNGNGVPRDRS